MVEQIIQSRIDIRVLLEERPDRLEDKVWISKKTMVVVVEFYDRNGEEEEEVG